MRKRFGKKRGEYGGRRPTFVYDNHPLVSRRDFLNAGLIQFSAFVTAPSLLGLLLHSPEVQAACADNSQNPSTMPCFIQLNLSGGAALGSNFISRAQDGSLNSSYSLMGLGSASLLNSAPPEAPMFTNFAMSRQVNSGFSNTDGVFYYNSGLLKGVMGYPDPTNKGDPSKIILDAAGNSVVSQGTTGTKLAGPPGFVSNTAIFSVLTQTQDDTSTLKFDLSGLVRQAGLYGTSLPILTTSGFGQSPALVSPPNPLPVGSLQDLKSAVGVQGPLGQQLTQQRSSSIFKLIQTLSESQATSGASIFSAMADSAAVQTALGCAVEKNLSIVQTPAPNVDPQQVSALTGIWNFASSTELVFASCAYNALIGQAGSVRLNMGGYDYHDGTRTSGDGQDYAAGLIINKLLRTAQALGKKLFLYVSTDGTVRSNDTATDDRAPWVSDRGQANNTLVFVYDPVTSPVLVRSAIDASAPNSQIGYFTTGQAADNNYLPGWNDVRASASIFANYLRFAYAGATTGGGGAMWKSVYDSIVGPAAVAAGLVNTASVPLVADTSGAEAIYKAVRL